MQVILHLQDTGRTNNISVLVPVRTSIKFPNFANAKRYSDQRNMRFWPAFCEIKKFKPLRQNY